MLIVQIIPNVPHHHRLAVEIVGRDIEKSLDLPGVQIDGQHARCTGFGDQIGHQLRGNRRAGPGFAILPGIAEIGNHRRDALGAGAPQCIDHDQQFHQIVVGGKACRLDDENVLTPHVLFDFDKHLHIGEPPHQRLGERNVQVLTDGLRQRTIAVAGQQLHSAHLRV